MPYESFYVSFQPSRSTKYPWTPLLKIEASPSGSCLCMCIVILIGPKQTLFVSFMRCWYHPFKRIKYETYVLLAFSKILTILAKPNSALTDVSRSLAIYVGFSREYHKKSLSSGGVIHGTPNAPEYVHAVKYRTYTFILLHPFVQVVNVLPLNRFTTQPPYVYGYCTQCTKIHCYGTSRIKLR